MVDPGVRTTPCASPDCVSSVATFAPRSGRRPGSPSAPESCASATRRRPVLQAKAFHPCELCRVGRNQRRLVPKRLAGDEKVISIDGFTERFKGCPHPPGVLRILWGEIQNLERT